MAAPIILDALKVAVGAIVSIVIYRLTQRNLRKELKYQFTYGEVAIQNTFKSDLEIIYKGKKVEDASAVTIVIKNTGHVPIQKSDYEGGIKLDMPGSAGILTARVSSVPENVFPSFRFENWDADKPNERIIAPMLFNPGDRLSLFLLVSGFGKEVRMSGRIAGVKQIEHMGTVATVDITWQMIGWLLASMIMSLFAETKWSEGKVHLATLSGTQTLFFLANVAAIVLTVLVWRSNISKRGL